MDGIETNMQHIQNMDIDMLAIYLSDINIKDVSPLEMKKWLESEYRPKDDV